QYNYCLDLLSRRGYSSRELKDKLINRGVSEEMAVAILSRLKEQKLISDEAFQESFVRSRQTYHKQGFYKIRQELARKGISLSREDYDHDAELANLKELVGKLLTKNVEHKKIMQRMLNKGFRYGDIVSVLKEQSSQEEVYEEYDEYES
ncbi:MAG: regulatory protein RecX, partial [Clostridia bacterium]|nr:regulatory protein RecX [Clostridia bacterium]